MAKAKEPAKREIEYNLAKKQKLRMIFHKDIRNVHFMWNPNVKPYLTEFSRKLPLLVNGTLEETETTENDSFKEYIQKWEADELEEGQTNPIEPQVSENFTLDVTNMGRVAIATADDPFFFK